nr:MAG TPA: hypothetical protein [Caudoviricetes sp.]
MARSKRARRMEASDRWPVAVSAKWQECAFGDA